jgi:hypothetical protein
MALSQPRTVFGIHSISPYDLKTGEFLGTAKVLKGGNFALSGEVISLTGGSNKFPWQVEDGLIESTLELTLNEYADWAFELFLGQKPTKTAAEDLGSVTAGVNKNGVSIIDAANGISIVKATIGEESDLAFAKYVIKAVSVNTFDVYASSDVNFAGKVYEDDELKINDTPIDVSATDGVLTGYGLSFAMVGVPAFVIGDTAEFEVKNINTGSFDAKFGSTSAVYPTFGAILMAQAQGTGRLFELDVFSLKAIGMPINMSANEFSEYSVSMTAFYNAEKDGVFSMREVL